MTRGRCLAGGAARYGVLVLTDVPLDQLRAYRGVQVAPDDFDAFWQATLAGSRSQAAPPVLEPVETPLTTVDVVDVTFSGFGGDPVRAWLRTPAGATGPLPTVVQYVGYGGGRGHAVDDLFWASSGFAHLMVDTRGQGSGWSVGDTPDPHGTGPQVPGVMTRGVLDPETYYYRRLVTDAVLAVDAARTLDVVDPERIAVLGGSQGGGLALAVAGLRDDLAAVVARVPFLCDFPRALMVTDAYPYREVVDYLSQHREHADAVMRTLSYVDGTLFAERAAAPALITVALMDATCPPATVFAAHARYAGEAELTVWPYNGHEGGGVADDLAAVAFVRARTA